MTKRLVTSKAVADELKKYTPTAKLKTDFLKKLLVRISEKDGLRNQQAEKHSVAMSVLLKSLTPDGEKSSTAISTG